MDAVEIATTVTSVAAGVGAAAYATKRAWRLARKVGHLVDDVLGEPARGDQPERPGLMGQIQEMRRDLTDVQRRVCAIEAELEPNGGTSIKDQVTRIERATTTRRQT